MKRMIKRILAATLITVLLAGVTITGFSVRAAQAIDLGSILKIGGVVLVISTFGKDIDKTINKVLSQNQVAAVGASKVVPIFSIGRGAYIGAAQVMGTPADVKRVKGVVAGEATLGKLSGSYLAPISTQKPSGGSGLNKVDGVGVSAIVDLHL